jgi:hypothetical protein
VHEKNKKELRIKPAKPFKWNEAGLFIRIGFDSLAEQKTVNIGAGFVLDKFVDKFFKKMEFFL